MYAEVVRRLFLVGGSAVTCVADFLGLAGGKEANIVVLPHASSVPAEVAQEMVETLKKLGARNVRVVMPDEKLDLDGADAVYMLGGDQSNLVDRLGKEGVAELKRAFARGVLIAGSSAGAACIGELMISGGMPNGTWNPKTLTTRDGLGLASGLVVDTHFAQRRRYARPRAAMNQALNKGYGLLSGVGLDEDTGVLFQFGKRGRAHCTVYGQHHAWVYEPRGRNRRVVVSNRSRTVRGVDSCKYSRGQSFRLKRTSAAN